MKKQNDKLNKAKHSAHPKRNNYEAPAIIFEGRITTRAGSSPLDQPSDVDPADLFGS